MGDEGGVGDRGGRGGVDACQGGTMRSPKACECNAISKRISESDNHVYYSER